MSGGMSTATAIAVTTAAVSAIGAGVSAMGAIQQGNAQKAEAGYEATQANQAAGQAQASGQRAAITQKMNTDYAVSNANAAASGNGGSGTDPTAITNDSMIQTVGNYKANTAMYDGDAKAQSLRNQATADVYQGDLAQQTGDTKATTSIISGASSLFGKYADMGNGMAADGNPAGAYKDSSGTLWNPYGE